MEEKKREREINKCEFKSELKEEEKEKEMSEK